MVGRTIAAAALLVAARGVAARGLVVSPSAVFAQSGEAVTRTLVLRPTSAGPTRVAIGVVAFSVDEDGRPSLTPRPGPRDASSLINVSPRSVVLDGNPAEITLTLGKSETRGSVWAAVVMDVEPVEVAAPAGAPMMVVTRVVVPVVITSASGEDSVAIRDLCAWAGPAGIEVTALLANDGPAVVRAAADVALEDGPEGASVEVATRHVPAVLLFPGQSRRISLRLGSSAPPSGSVRLLLTAGTRIAESVARVE